jgi:hypothetical protein
MIFPLRLLKPPFIYRGLHHSYRDCMGLSIATLDYRRVILISTYKMPISYHTMWLPEMETSHTVWHVLPEIASGYCTVCIVCFGKWHIYEWLLEKNDETWSHGDVLRLYEITIAGSWEKNTAPQLGAAVPQNVSEGMMALINHDPWDPYPNH